MSDVFCLPPNTNVSAVAMCGLGHDDGEVAWTKAAGREGVNFMVPSLASRSLEGDVACVCFAVTGSIL